MSEEEDTNMREVIKTIAKEVGDLKIEKALLSWVSSLGTHTVSEVLERYAMDIIVPYRLIPFSLPFSDIVSPFTKMQSFYPHLWRVMLKLW